MTTGDLLVRQVERDGGRAALIYDGHESSFAELDRRSNRAARVLSSLGIGKGDRVALFAANRPEWVDVFFAASKIGAVLVPVSPRLRSSELNWIVNHSGSDVLVFEHELLEEVDRLRPVGPGRLKFVRLTSMGTSTSAAAPLSWASDYDAGVAAADDTRPAADVRPEDLHSISYTSGTTGLPKAAMLTHSNVVVGTHEMSVANFGYSDQDVFLNPTPLSHRAGWARLIQSVGVGAPQVLVRQFVPEDVLRAIEQHRVTFAGLVPTMLRLIDQASVVTRFDTSSLRTILTTAEGCPLSLRHRILEMFPTAELISLFASTEAGQIALLPAAEQMRRPTAAGRPLSGVDVRVVDDQRDPLPAGETGEIVVRTGEPGEAGVMLGYWNGSSVDTEGFEDGWFLTGDCGHLDEEGYLHVSDRKKDMILSGGLNIYSREVEDVLRQHPSVADAAVIGVPDATWGESVVAVVVLTPGEEAEASVLIEHCKAALASYKKPRHVHFVSALPRNVAGKVLKYRLRARYGSDDAASTTQNSEADNA